MRILIAEDEPEILTILCNVFHELGHEVTCFSSLEELLRETRNCRQRYDVCILDIVFKGEGALDIYEVAGRCARKVVVITGYADRLDREALEQMGVVVIEKPFSLADLLTAVENGVVH